MVLSSGQVVEMSDNIDGLKKREVALYEMFEGIAKKFGKWDQGIKSDGAHYVAKSPFGREGMVCANCVFFLGGRKCEIVEGDIAPEAICKFWVIRDDLLKD
jgi:hypothetical protein